jgi:hypothetical protein
LTKNKEPLPLPDKKIPPTVAIIGTFEVGIGLVVLIVIFLTGQFDANSMALLILSGIYMAMGAGLWAIQEWARTTNVILHIVAIPYVVITSTFLDGPAAMPQLIIAVAIIIALTRPKLKHKFQTVVPKEK